VEATWPRRTTPEGRGPPELSVVTSVIMLPDSMGRIRVLEPLAGCLSPFLWLRVGLATVAYSQSRGWKCESQDHHATEEIPKGSRRIRGWPSPCHVTRSRATLARVSHPILRLSDFGQPAPGVFQGQGAMTFNGLIRGAPVAIAEALRTLAGRAGLAARAPRHVRSSTLEALPIHDGRRS
jgi:hypothetical protein